MSDSTPLANNRRSLISRLVVPGLVLALGASYWVAGAYARPEPPAGHRLAVGDPAPAFQTVDLNGHPVSLEAFKGKRVLLSFYRFAACVFCNVRTHDVIEHYPAWHKQGLEVLGFFESPASSMKEYVGKQAPPYMLVPDPERLIYAQYGVVDSDVHNKAMYKRLGMIFRAAQLGLLKEHPEGNPILIPADFLIEADGRVAAAYYGEDMGDHMPFEQIDAFVKRK